MEEYVKTFGFDSLKEFIEMVANIDLSYLENQIAFKKWQENDGSKIGLLKIKK